MCAAGFLQQFAGVCRPDVPEKNMSSVIEQLSGGRIPTRVLCCGHSLGGALATLGTTYIAAVCAASWQYLFVIVVWRVDWCETDHCQRPES